MGKQWAFRPNERALKLLRGDCHQSKMKFQTETRPDLFLENERRPGFLTQQEGKNGKTKGHTGVTPGGLLRDCPPWAPLGILPHPHSVRVTGSVQPCGDLPRVSDRAEDHQRSMAARSRTLMLTTRRSANPPQPSPRSEKRSTRKPVAVCPSRGGSARAVRPDEAAWPRRQSAPRTSCRAAIRPCSKPAAPTSPAGRTC
jgi:hypothetical protein